MARDPGACIMTKNQMSVLLHLLLQYLQGLTGAAGDQHLVVMGFNTSVDYRCVRCRSCSDCRNWESFLEITKQTSEVKGKTPSTHVKPERIPTGQITFPQPKKLGFESPRSSQNLLSSVIMRHWGWHGVSFELCAILNSLSLNLN